jgi:hypothetical protein
VAQVLSAGLWRQVAIEIDIVEVEPELDTHRPRPCAARSRESRGAELAGDVLERDAARTVISVDSKPNGPSASSSRVTGGSTPNELSSVLSGVGFEPQGTLERSRRLAERALAEPPSRRRRCAA